jgi:hypothetical protein
VQQVLDIVFVLDEEGLTPVVSISQLSGNRVKTTEKGFNLLYSSGNLNRAHFFFRLDPWESKQG